jgi:hypothetical protein
VLGMASPIDVLHSRQKRPLFQDDSLRRGEFPPRQANGGLVGGPRFCTARLSGDLDIGKSGDGMSNPLQVGSIFAQSRS